MAGAGPGDPRPATGTPSAPDIQRLLEQLAGSAGLPPELVHADTLLHDAAPDEAALYLRLWLLAGQGRVLDALELVRAAGPRFPGSSALAYLHAILEHHAGDPAAALEAALRASALVPAADGPRRLMELLARQEAAEQERRGPGGAQGMRMAPRPVDPGIPSLWAGAVLGSALLHPPGSHRPLGAHGAPTPREAGGHGPRPAARLAWVVPLAIAGLAVGALRQPFLAAGFLAAMALWYGRRGPGAPSRE